MCRVRAPTFLPVRHPCGIGCRHCADCRVALAAQFVGFFNPARFPRRVRAIVQRRCCILRFIRLANLRTCQYLLKCFMSQSSNTAIRPISRSSSDPAGGVDGAITISTVKRLSESAKRPLMISMAAVIIAVGNLIVLLTLLWAEGAFFSDSSPAVSLVSVLLTPLGLIGLSVYRSHLAPHDDEPMIEKLGPYVLNRKLGSGGMGEVFLAEHQLMKRKCAIKLIHPEQARDSEMRNSFEREAKATAHLTHWNTVQVYDYGTAEDGRFYYVMEYLRGVNLADFVQQFGVMEPQRVVYVLKQVCEALYEADCVGLVHRDIKPSNILLTERGRFFDVAKLLDFGLVQPVSQQPVQFRNVNKKLRGSPSYMCPEQAVGLSPDVRGDLYSLGCVAYFLLTGRPPFVDENPIMLIVAHATAAVPTFEEIGVDVPADLGRVILRCLQRDPGLRYESARQLLEDLECCECFGQWTWKSAEKWWKKHDPAPSQADDVTAPNETMQLNRNTAPDLKASQINHNEDTIIFDKVNECEAAASSGN